MLSCFDKWTIITLLCLSVLVWVIPITVYFYRRNRERIKGEPCRRLGVSRMLVFSGCLLIAVWCLRYAVGYYGVLFPGEDSPLYWWEEIVNSIVHALQTFSMDEGYTEYIIDGKKMMVAVFGEAELWQIIYGAYASVLNLVAPIAGGVFILEVLAQIFPEIQLRLAFWNVRRKKYFFSELNPTSLALAKSIYREKRDERPLLVFTDTYIDDEQEKDYELFLEAKRYGAICVRKDLSHVIKPRWGEREYYLMDENEFGNLQTLLGLMEDRNIRYIKDSCIYLFVQTDAHVQVEKQAKKLLEEKKHLLKGGEKPIIVPVRGYRNLVQNLLTNVPLYEPLIHKADPTGLEVTILGNGVIGTEAFLSVYWMGQMLVSQSAGETSCVKQCDLTVNVISKDTPEAFWAQIDYVNPDIRKTVTVVQEDKTVYPAELLMVDGEGINKPYATVRYTQLDVKTGGLWTDESKGIAQLLGSDYYIVALGNDSDNISIAEKLRCFIGKRHVEQEKEPDKVVIAYAVFDSELTAALNEENIFKSRETGMPDIYMQAFGDLDQVYSCDNVYMSKNLLWATETGAAFLRGQYDNSHRHDNMSRTGASASEYEDANYKYWASLARAMHMKYKLFALGWIPSSVFDCLTAEEAETRRKQVQAQCARYQLFSAATANGLALTGEQQVRYQELEEKKDFLAWLEHRRWNAFTRTMGYQYVDVNKMLKAKESSHDHKDMRLKLHACLVEARMPDPARGVGYLTEPGQTPDLLDVVTAVKREVKPKQKDLKIYDYYQHEFDNFKPEKKLAEELRSAGVRNADFYCDHNRFRDSISCQTEEGTVHLVTLEAVRWALNRDYAVVSQGKDIKGAFEFQKLCYAPTRTTWLKSRLHKK